MSRLKGQIPRGPYDHRTREGQAYTAYCRAVLGRLGTLPAAAMPTLREAGCVVVELGRLAADIERARRRQRLRDGRRLRRERAGHRVALVALERRLEELAAQRPSDLARDLAWRSGGDAG